MGEHKVKATFLTPSDLPIPSAASPMPHSKPMPTPMPKKQPKKPVTKPKDKPKDTPKPKEAPKESPQEKPTPNPTMQETTPQETTPQETTPQEPKEVTPEEISQLEQTLQAPLENFIPQSPAPQQSPNIPIENTLAYQLADPYTKKNISEIYGEEFGELGKEEQEFIINNLAIIGKITQNELQYPRDAAMLGQSGMNVVEFYLHPDGSISDLKVITPSGFFLLDRNSVITIKKAYGKYPHPKTKTLIRFFISYFLRN